MVSGSSRKNLLDQAVIEREASERNFDGGSVGLVDSRILPTLSDKFEEQDVTAFRSARSYPLQ